MSDPVAEAAAALAKQQSEPSLLDKAMDTIHDLEAKVEHLIHPESVPNVTPGSPATDASATLSDVSGQPITSLDSAKPSESLPTETQAPASVTGSAEPSTITPTSSVESELPNILAGVPVADTAPADSTASIAGADLPNVPPASTSGTPQESTPNADSGLKADVPNAVSGAAESTTDTASAIPASGSGETSSIEGSSAVTSVEQAPLHVRVAGHLEAIFTVVKAHVDGVQEASAADTSALKTHVGDILHRISNGMAVSEGELVQKLESLYRML